LRPYVLILLVILVLIALTWANYRFAAQNPGGNDFLPRWLGTRLFFTEGWNPYFDRTTQAIQNMVYGRPAISGEDQVLFVYPFYSIVIFGPYAVIGDYVLARALWMTTLEAALFVLAGLSISLSRWRPAGWLLVILLLFSLLWYHGLRPVINGNASILCAMLIALGFLAIRSNHDVLSGVLFALTTIKPQMVILLLPFILIWAVSQRRWPLFWTLLGSLAILIAATSLLLPSWVIDNLRQILAYPGYTLPGTPGAIFASWLPGIGCQMGWLLTAFMIGLLLLEWWVAWQKDFNWFYWTACLTLVITNLIGVRTATENFIAIFPGLILVFTCWDERARRAGKFIVLVVLMLLLFGLWALFLGTMIKVDQPTQNPVMFFPLPFFMLIGLYWVRWWALRPQRGLMDALRKAQIGV
jgi:hypothetical protein